MPRRVVITGLGAVTALGTTPEALWSGLVEGKSGVAPLTLFDTTDFKVHFGGQVHGWDGPARFGVKEARHLDRFTQFALTAAESAVIDSGIDFEAYPTERSGVMIGSGIGGLTEFEVQHSICIERGPSRISPFTIPKLMVNACSGHVSIRWGLQGPCSAVATACASAANAIGDALQLHPVGPGRRDDRRRQRGRDHPHGAGRLRRPAGPVDPERRSPARQPAVRPRSRRLRPGRGGGDPDPRGRVDRPGPRREDLRRAARLRHVGRRLTHHRPRRAGPGCGPGHEALRCPTRSSTRPTSATSTPTARAPSWATSPRRRR